MLQRTGRLTGETETNKRDHVLDPDHLLSMLHIADMNTDLIAPLRDPETEEMLKHTHLEAAPDRHLPDHSVILLNSKATEPARHTGGMLQTTVPA